MITVNNYSTEVKKVNFDKLPAALKEGHEYFLKAQAAYSKSAAIKETIDIFLQKLNTAIELENKQAQTTARIKDDFAEPKKSEKKDPVKKSPKTVSKTAKPQKKEPKPVAPKKEKPSVKQVEHLEPEVKFIKRFVTLLGKEKPAKAFIIYYNSIAKAAAEKVIDKESQYRDELRYILDSLYKIINGRNSEVIKVVVDDQARLETLKSIAAGEKVYSSVQIIKSIIGLAGKMVNQARLLSLVNRISRINENDKYFKKLQDLKENILSPVLKKLKNECDELPVNISKQELYGLNGLIGCGKTPVKKKDYAATVNTKLDGLVTAEDIASLKFSQIALDGRYKSEFTKLFTDTQILIWGKPGHGKTVYLLKFAQFLAEKGLKVLYQAHEEWNRSTLTEKIQKFRIGHPNLKFVKSYQSLDPGLSVNDFDVVFWDSINTIGLNLQGYKDFMAAYPGKVNVLIVQATKEGDFRGGLDWEHEVDIAGEILNRNLVLRKNRLDPDFSEKSDKLLLEEAIREREKRALINQSVKKKIEEKEVDHENK